ncbi:MAG TPA: bifunctional 5,10-methylenetetrahydrofolate dehydrogenase/5,10-methenyltetrahydrofolate cyclohydrolase [Actinospica sp.]|nr:bifunctional 5,10-methylenetetrahydrofolate dehydrogenase/5,10-methenyltetrahydrofolate cyclohydrolase [Actinospica sp.]HWG23053.1 bifunctional 5,10-methylenetetrahydrofolate dehydrogenase/5,10-methenyltetrahydrofolate cyclohydrolase [Actinospica sp.]
MLLSGRELSARIRNDTAAAAHVLRAAGTSPALAVVTATADEASASYVRSIARTAARAEVDCEIHDLGPSASEEDIRDWLAKLSADPAVHGIILQTPLPSGVSPLALAGAIDPAKDIDGANPLSLGRLVVGLPAFAPATAAAVLKLLDHHAIGLSGRRVVVVGRSTVVGKPVAHLLLARDATVTICHSRTADLAEYTREADVVVVAAGRAGLVTGAQLRAGCCVIDVGTNTDGAGGIIGDVEAASVLPVAKALSPVPGGVGPVTTALLIEHTVRAAASALR